MLLASTHAATVTVSTTTDEVNGNTTSIANLIATPGGAGISLREAINPFCDHAGAFTMSGVTIRFGRNAQPYGAADFSFTGGGMDWCGNGAGSLTTLGGNIYVTNSVAATNRFYLITMSGFAWLAVYCAVFQ